MATVGKLNVKLTARIREFTAKMDQAQAKMRETGERLGEFGRAFQRIGLVGGVAAGGIVAATSSFDRAMRRTAAIASGTAENFGASFSAMSAAAIDFASRTEFTASQVGEGMQFLAMAGNNAAQTIAAIGPTLQLATAAGVELGEAADTVTNIMAGFGTTTSAISKDLVSQTAALQGGVIATDELAIANDRLRNAIASGNKQIITQGDVTDELTSRLSRTNDVLVATFTGSNTSLSELGRSFKKLGPTAALFNTSLEEGSAALGILGNAGIKAEEAGTGLKRALVSLASPTKKAREAMADLGLKTGDLLDPSVGFTGVIKQLENAQGKFADVGKETEFAAKLFEIFGLRGGPIMGALLAQGSEEVAKLQGRIEALQGTAGEQGIAAFLEEVQLESFAGQTNLVISAIDGLAKSIGSELLPALKPVAKAIAAVFNWLSANLSPGLKLAIGLSLLAGSAALFLAGTFIVLAGASMKVAASWPDFIKFLGDARSKMLAVSTSALPVIAAILLMAVAIVALIGVFRNEKVQAFFGEVASGVSALVDEIGMLAGFVLQAFTDIAAPILLPFEMLAEAIGPLLGDVIDWVVGVAGDIADAFSNAGPELVATMAKIPGELQRIAGDSVEPFLRVVGEIPAAFINAFSQLKSTLLKIVFDLFGQRMAPMILGGISGAIDAVLAVATNGASLLSGFFGNAFSSIVDFGREMLGGLWGSIEGFFSGVLGDAGQFVRGLVQAVTGIGKSWRQVFQGIDKMVTAVIKAIVRQFDLAVSFVIEALFMIPRAIASVQARVAKGVRELIQKIPPGILKRIGIDPAEADAFAAGLERGATRAGATLDGVKNKLKEGLQAVPLLEQIEDVSGGVLGFTVDILNPENLVDTLRSGLDGIFGEGADSFGKKLSEAMEGFKPKDLPSINRAVDVQEDETEGQKKARKEIEKSRDALIKIIERERSAHERLASSVPNVTQAVQEYIGKQNEINKAIKPDDATSMALGMLAFSNAAATSAAELANVIGETVTTGAAEEAGDRLRKSLETIAPVLDSLGVTTQELTAKARDGLPAFVAQAVASGDVVTAGERLRAILDGLAPSLGDLGMSADDLTEQVGKQLPKALAEIAGDGDVEKSIAKTAAAMRGLRLVGGKLAENLDDNATSARRLLITNVDAITNSVKFASAMALLKQNADALGLTLGEVSRIKPPTFDEIQADVGPSASDAISEGIFGAFRGARGVARTVTEKLDDGTEVTRQVTAIPDETLKGATNMIGGELAGALSGQAPSIGGMVGTAIGAAFGNPAIGSAIGSAVENLIGQVGSAVEGLINGLASAVKGAGDTLASAIPESKLAGAVKQAASFVASLLESFAPIAGVAAVVVVVGGLLVGVMSAVALAFAQLLWIPALFVGPILIAGAALTAALSAIAVVIGAVLLTIALWVGIFVAWLAGVIAAGAAMLAAALAPVVAAIGASIAPAVAVIGGALAALGAMLASIGAGIAAFFGPILAAIGGFISGALALVGGAVAAIVSFVGGVITAFFAPLAALIGGIVTAVGSFLAAVGSLTVGILGLLAAFAGVFVVFGVLAALSTQTESFGDFMTAIGNSVGRLIEALEPIFQNFLFLAGAFDVIIDILIVFANAFGQSEGLARSLFEFVKLGLAAAVVFGIAIAAAQNALITWVQDFLDSGGGAALVDAIVGIVDVLKAGAQAILAAFDIIAVALPEETREALAGASDAIEDIDTTGIRDAIGGLGDALEPMRANTGELVDLLDMVNALTFEELQERAENLRDLDKTNEDVSESLSNVPEGFKLAAEQFRAIEADAVAAGSTFNDETGTFERGDTWSIGVVNIRAADPRNLWEQIAEETRRRNRRSTGNDFLDGEGSGRGSRGNF